MSVLHSPVLFLIFEKLSKYHAFVLSMTCRRIRDVYIKYMYTKHKDAIEQYIKDGCPDIEIYLSQKLVPKCKDLPSVIRGHPHLFGFYNSYELNYPKLAKKSTVLYCFLCGKTKRLYKTLCEKYFEHRHYVCSDCNINVLSIHGLVKICKLCDKLCKTCKCGARFIPQNKCNYCADYTCINCTITCYDNCKDRYKLKNSRKTKILKANFSPIKLQNFNILAKIKNFVRKTKPHKDIKNVENSVILCKNDVCVCKKCKNVLSLTLCNRNKYTNDWFCASCSQLFVACYTCKKTSNILDLNIVWNLYACPGCL